MELFRKYTGFDSVKQMEVSDMLDWFLNVRYTYIVGMPKVGGKWTVWVVFTNSVNTIDGKLNMVDVEVKCKTKVDAEKAGIEWILSTLCEAKEMVKTMTEEEKTAVLQRAKRHGWEVDEKGLPGQS